MGNSVQTEPVIRFQDFQVNLETGEVWKAGVRLKLQDQPFKVLATLVQRPGQVVTREELRQLIWPEESFGDFDHAINLAITKLRGSLGDSADVPHLIETLPRRGYRFIADIESPVASKPESEVNAGRAGTAGVLPRAAMRWLALGAAALVLIAAFVGYLVRRARRSVPTPQIARSVIKLAPGHMLDSVRFGAPWGFGQPTRTAMVISHDGHFIVYSAISEKEGPQEKSQLYLRPIDQLEAKPIAGTENGLCPFLSPDDHWVGFWVDFKLMKVPIDGGVPVTLGELPRLGVSWGPDNTIAVAMLEGLARISADGGRPEILTTFEKPNERYNHRLPHWLPDGRSLLFTIFREIWDQHPRIAVLDVKSKKWRVLLDNAADARYIPTGHLVFMRQGILTVVPFDLEKREITGQPVPAVANVMQALNTATANTGAGQFSFSDSGSLVYAVGGTNPDRDDSLVWVDRRGKAQPIAPFQAPFWSPRLSPDGTRIAYMTAGEEWLAWLYDLNRGTATRLIQEGKSDFPLWTPDGKHIVVKHWQTGEPNLFWLASDGSTPLQRLTTSDHHQVPGSFTPDGTTLAFVEAARDTGWDINLLNVKSRQVSPFLNTKADEFYPEISPDGHWIAHLSSESGRWEVYVRPFPGPGGKWQISSNSGTNPIWSRDGKQLFYVSANHEEYWVVDIRTDGHFSAGKPRLLFKSKDFVLGEPTHTWDISPDGQHFLMAKFGERKPNPVREMILVQNWFEEVKRLAPAGKK